MAYQIDCTMDDGFMVRSEDEQEAIEMIQEHAREKHEMDMDDDEARDMLAET